MNPAEMYDEVALDFPVVHPEDHEWVNVHDGEAAKLDAVSGLVERYIDSSSVVLVIHAEPGIAAVLPRASVASYIAGHILKHEIQIADPRFTSFVAVRRSGVATGWRHAD